ncbi:MAG: VOC family protein [Proteobacteria bacterium]|nr:VOC family protein [Pseudomonadota bacterium]
MSRRHPCRTLALAAMTAFIACAAPHAAAPAAVQSVEAVAIPVTDMDRAVRFYTKVLTFERVADREVAGDAYEHLYGVFGVRLRAVRLRLGDEAIELVQFLAPRGRPPPADSRANDRWFQHIAIVVADLDRAYALLRVGGAEHASKPAGAAGLEPGTRAGSALSISATRTATSSKCCTFHRERVTRDGSAREDASSSASTTPRWW